MEKTKSIFDEWMIAGLRGFLGGMAWRVLKFYGVMPDKEVAFGWIMLAVVIASLGSEFIGACIDRFLIKREIKKVARELAIFQGKDPKNLDYKAMKVTKDENGIIEVEIMEKKSKQGEKK